jgi:hypothetical protein
MPSTVSGQGQSWHTCTWYVSHDQRRRDGILSMAALISVDRSRVQISWSPQVQGGFRGPEDHFVLPMMMMDEGKHLPLARLKRLDGEKVG